jgi:hypothetical protein
VYRSYPFLPKIFLILGMTMAGLACAIPGLGNEPPAPEAGGPAVTISSPGSGQVIQPGGEIKIQSTSLDPDGMVRSSGSMPMPGPNPTPHLLWPSPGPLLCLAHT